MTRCSGARTVARLCLAAATSTVMLVTGCGLPSGGSVQRVDDDTVPYRLLEPAGPSSAATVPTGRPVGTPVVIWVTAGHLMPEATDGTCSAEPEILVDQLLDTLAAGPSDDTRGDGASSAIPPDSQLELLEITGDTAEVNMESETSLSAEQLPVAVGQVVLTVTSVPTIRSVELVNDGEPLQVPLPGGVLTSEAVTAADYADLLPDRFATPESFGCPRA